MSVSGTERSLAVGPPQVRCLEVNGSLRVEPRVGSPRTATKEPRRHLKRKTAAARTDLSAYCAVKTFYLSPMPSLGWFDRLG